MKFDSGLQNLIGDYSGHVKYASKLCNIKSAFFLRKLPVTLKISM